MTLVEEAPPADLPDPPLRTRLEVSRCPVCGAERGETRFSFEPFAVVECPRCTSAYLSPRPSTEALGAIYRDGYYEQTESREVGYADYASLEPGIRRTFARRYARIARCWRSPGPRRSVVEVGCALGFSLDGLRERFEERLGVDLAPEAIEEVRRRGHRGFCGPLEDAGIPDASVDLVLCLETIEHIAEPRPLIAEMARIVRPGGALAIVTPDYNSRLRRVSGREWVSFKIPEHVVYFSRPGLDGIFTEHGLSRARYLSDVQYSPLSLILDRAGKVAPRAAALARLLTSPLRRRDPFVPVPNGMFLAVAEKPR